MQLAENGSQLLNFCVIIGQLDLSRIRDREAASTHGEGELPPG